VPKGGQTFSISDFTIAKYPVTNAQFQVFVDATDGYRNGRWWDFSEEASTAWRPQNLQPKESTYKGDDLPRTDVAWYEAIAYCQWLSHKTGHKIMLPTEQQWQRAAQGDTGWKYPWGDNETAPYYNDNALQMIAVSSYPKSPTPYDVMDMVGNQSEWCLNQYNLGGNNLAGADIRLMRGGSYYVYDVGFNLPTSVSFRGSHSPDKRLEYVGFRLARLS
jgi:formylglycine-generating enzyme required for sulfatase activity